MKAVLIPGDGIGKEISKSVVDITKAMKLDIEWVEYQAGAEYAATTKEVFEPGLVDAIKEYKWALKGPTATPIGTGFRRDVYKRQDFGLLSIALTLRFIIYPLYQSWISQKNLVNEKTIVEDLEKTIEIRIEEIDGSNHYKQYLKI